MSDLFTRSIEVIKENQHSSGAYLASPNFSTYRYCWYRDGSFIAYAMNLIGEHESAARFHDWASSNVLSRVDIIQRALNKKLRNEILPSEEGLHTRYTLEGLDAEQDWPNFQLDGFGTWLWSLGEYQKLSGATFKPTWVEAAQWTAKYLSALWRQPCSDCWEEFPDQIHLNTLGSIYGGFQGVSKILSGEFDNEAGKIHDYILSNGIHNGYFMKYLGSKEVDASLIGLAVPYNVVSADHINMKKTIEKIEQDLQNQAGLHRYGKDTYYGGGEWILLTAWLGWYWAKQGNTERALELYNWVVSQADGNGDLPEQVPSNLIKQDYYEVWRKRWGEIANPLLWSHANFLILHHNLNLK